MNDKAPKKAAPLRTYPIHDGTKQRWVEAPSLASAIVHVFKPNTGEALNASAVLDVIRQHGIDAIEKVAAPATKAE